jgi:hypothetical protein
MMMMPDSQVHTKVRSIISARTTAKKSLMKIHRDIHESHLILTLDLRGLRVKRDCKITRHHSFSLSKVNNKILEKSPEDIIPKSPLGTPGISRNR